MPEETAIFESQNQPLNTSEIVACGRIAEVTTRESY
jgi:hypothetical protein